MTRKNWTTVAIPKSLHEKIKELVEDEKFGYRTVGGFIQAAVQERLIELGVFTYTETPKDKEDSNIDK